MVSVCSIFPGLSVRATAVERWKGGEEDARHLLHRVIFWLVDSDVGRFFYFSFRYTDSTVRQCTQGERCKRFINIRGIGERSHFSWHIHHSFRKPLRQTEQRPMRSSRVRSVPCRVSTICLSECAFLLRSSKTTASSPSSPPFIHSPVAVSDRMILPLFSWRPVED